MKTVLINNTPITIFDGAIGLYHSGGADSALLLYVLMQNALGPIHIFTCASRLKGVSTPQIALNVIDKCITLTGNKDIFHHTFFVEEQTHLSLFSQPKDIIKSLKVVYTGLTSYPPDNVLNSFKESSNLYEERNPNISKLFYDGKYYRPFVNLNKKDICKMYESLGIIDTVFPLTRSCEHPTLRSGHCGECWWCEERLWGFNRLT